jgi:hypothetical protein
MEITRTTIGLTSFNTARKIKRLKGVGDLKSGHIC